MRNDHLFPWKSLQQYSPGSFVQHGGGFLAVLLLPSAAGGSCSGDAEGRAEIVTCWLGLLEHSRSIFPLCKCHCALHLSSHFLAQTLPPGACVFRSSALKRKQCISIWGKKLAQCILFFDIYSHQHNSADNLISSSFEIQCFSEQCFPSEAEVCTLICRKGFSSTWGQKNPKPTQNQAPTFSAQNLYCY